ncbi:hypothetical protein Glove_423g61 [Diversispora epigaea]|uniref:Uncharacterized protein n=1 Tax=Diversispora epigaea TaxID=1348612 RepID=A0A397GWV9_9GLOM|nr:hypothetical protein Glove_423g61 [Diversispora epigaea]
MKFSHFCLLTIVVSILLSPWWCFALLISVKEKIQSNNNDDHETFPEEKILSNNNDKFISNFASINLTFPSIPSIDVTVPFINDVKEFFSNTAESIKDFVDENKVIIIFIVVAIIGVVIGYFVLGFLLIIIQAIGFQIGVLAYSLAATMMSILGTAAWSIVPILQSIGAAGFGGLTYIIFPIFCALLFILILYITLK